MTTLKELGEFSFINAIAKGCHKHKSVLKGIGDDAAVVKLAKDITLLFTADMLIEDVHFKRNHSPQLIGHKAIACSLSDIAAMGGVPRYALISVAFPKNLKISFAKGLYQGMQNTAKKFGVSIIGGDTNAADKIIINVCICGLSGRKFISRGGARIGDKIFVTGFLGGSQSGKHLCFSPRIKEAQFLIKHYPINSMIDISDGLISDLGHITGQSKKTAILFEDKIPVSISADSIKDAYYTGEDFELLFTVSEKYEQDLLKRWPFKRVKLSCIGEITQGGIGVQIKTAEGKLKKVKSGGYRHF